MSACMSSPFISTTPTPFKGGYFITPDQCWLLKIGFGLSAKRAIGGLLDSAKTDAKIARCYREEPPRRKPQRAKRSTKQPPVGGA